MTTSGFTSLDFLILFSYLAATVAFGTLLGRGQKNLNDYFLGAKQIPWWAICGSIVATETSTLTFIGFPALAYAGNMTFLQVTLGLLVGKILVSVFLIPFYFRGEIQTAYEMLSIRFGKQARSLVAFLFQVTRALSDGVRLFATALVLSVVTDLSDLWTVFLIGIVTIIYTFYGGIRSVVWNDVIQLVIYLLGGVVAFFVILESLPEGWSTVVKLAGPAGKFQILDFSIGLGTAYTFWAGLVGGAFLTFASHGTDQLQVQRYLACGSRRISQLALCVSGVVVFFQMAFFLLIGVLLYAFYQQFPLQGELTQNDRIFPIFIVQHMPPGVSGFVIAAIFAAAMSTLSSSLNSLSSSSVHDFYRSYLVRQASDRHYLKAARMFTLVWGGVLIAISLLARNWGSVLEEALTLTSIPMGAVLGTFLLAIWTSRVGQSAALVGIVAGLATILVIHWEGWVAWTWYVLVGTSVTFGAGIICQAVTLRGAGPLRRS